MKENQGLVDNYNYYKTIYTISKTIYSETTSKTKHYIYHNVVYNTQN